MSRQKNKEWRISHHVWLTARFGKTPDGRGQELGRLVSHESIVRAKTSTGLMPAVFKGAYADLLAVNERRLRFDQGGIVDLGGGLADFRYVEALIKAREDFDLIRHINRNR